MRTVQHIHTAIIMPCRLRSNGIWKIICDSLIVQSVQQIRRNLLHRQDFDMLFAYCFNDLLRIGNTLLRVERHNTNCCHGLCGRAGSRHNIPPMPSDLYDHTYRAQCSQHPSFADTANRQSKNRNHSGKQTQPRYQCNNQRHIAFAIKIIRQHAQQHRHHNDCGD